MEALQSLQALDPARHEYLHSVNDYNAAQIGLMPPLGSTSHRPAASDASER
jgi:hypothetical protein